MNTNNSFWRKSTWTAEKIPTANVDNYGNVISQKTIAEIVWVNKFNVDKRNSAIETYHHNTKHTKNIGMIEYIEYIVCV